MVFKRVPRGAVVEGLTVMPQADPWLRFLIIKPHTSLPVYASVYLQK
jgi:hypothetical protein